MEFSRTYGAGNYILDGGTGKEITRSWTSPKIPNRSFRWMAKEIWPRYELGFVDGSFNYWIPTDGSGGLQGCTDKLNRNLNFTSREDGSDSEEYGYELDPAGGNGEFKLIIRESTLWHRMSIKIRLETETNYLDDTTLKLSGASCPYKINESDNTSVKLLSRTVSGTKVTYDYKIIPNGITTRRDKDQTLKESDEYDVKIDFKLGPNNNPSNSRGTVSIVSYYDSLDEEILFKTDQRPILFKWWQKPNLLYYVEMGFVEKPATAKSTPRIASSEYYKNNYNNTNFDLFLFIEFGISLDGGLNINWNQDWEKFLANKGITTINPEAISTVVPSDLATSGKFTFVIYGENKERFVIPSQNISLYFDKSDYVGSYAKYFKIGLSSTSANTEYTNDASHIHQSYYVDPSELKNTASYNENMKAIASWEANSKSNISFLLRRISTTDPWKCKVKASLEYIKGQMKYRGSTDPSERNNGSN